MNRKQGDGVKECYAAFERLKSNMSILEKFKNLPPDHITASVVSQEAGFDSGYLKKNRHNHIPLLSDIATFRNESIAKTTDISDSKKLSQTIRNVRSEVDHYKALYQESLGRELFLVAKLRQLENELEQALNSSNVLKSAFKGKEVK